MKMKKTIIALLLALVTVVSSAGALAAEVAAPANVGDTGIVSPQAEEKVWCTRVHNGWLQKRLWSITYGRWLTDWIDICPVEVP